MWKTETLKLKLRKELKDFLKDAKAWEIRDRCREMGILEY